MSTPSNPAQLTADEKFDGPFYAYVIASMGGSSVCLSHGPIVNCASWSF
jgi:hypothetical protein